MENVTAGGAGGYPQVFVVDSQAPVGFVPKMVPSKRDKMWMYILYLLVGLALLGVVVEAGCIYKLYHKTESSEAAPEANQSALKMKGDRDLGGSNEIPSGLPKPTDSTKPVAFLQGIGTEKHQDGVMRFQHETILKGLQYKEGKLHIQQEGFYYIYSKVYFSETCALFKHQVMWNSPRYSTPINVMQSLRYFCLESDEDKMRDNADVGNSFLGGVFQLHEGDTVYVYVNDTTLIRPGTNDNFFGVFMI